MQKLDKLKETIVKDGLKAFKEKIGKDRDIFEI